ncbi:MAG: dihydrofolate reductase family protein [Chloroflexi bacterium]|nr:dihydrofolate reductase family protein [Chloroflexota bacterium]MCC6894893.1 dihydrofolate reductase [Anaerolineae bacterium]
MGKVGFNMTMSLDGFIAGANDSAQNPLGDNGSHLFTWYSIGDTEYKMPGGDWKFNISAASAKQLDKALSSAGVLITGRRTFDIAGAWGGQHPVDLPIVVLTHNPPQEWVNKPNSPFTFVTDGIESAVEKAKAIAGDKDVELGTASTLQQALNAGLVDELHIDIAPVVLGKGVRLFDELGKLPLVLEQIASVEGQGVTHLSYRIVK